MMKRIFLLLSFATILAGVMVADGIRSFLRQGSDAIYQGTRYVQAVEGRAAGNAVCREGCDICVMHVPEGGCPVGWQFKQDVFRDRGDAVPGCWSLGPGAVPPIGVRRGQFCFDHLKHLEVIR